MDRRRFFSTSAVLGAAGLLLDGCGKPDEKLIPLLVPDEDIFPGLEHWVPTLCQQCPAGCGISVRVMPGESLRSVGGDIKKATVLQAKKVEGNPSHPVNHGKTCALCQAGVQVLYHPDRLSNPMKRVGPRGGGEYQPISWEAAFQELLSQLRVIQRSEKREGLAIAAGETVRGSLKTLVRRFAEAWGTQRLVFHESSLKSALKAAGSTCLGGRRIPVHDIASCRFLLSLEADCLETFLSPVHYGYAYGRFRQGTGRPRGRFIYAGPRLSATAACADRWLAARPRSQKWLALAMAEVLVAEKLFDQGFVNEHTVGFEQWANSLRSCSPGLVAARIGISPETIAELAREFSRNQPGIVLADSDDPETHEAVWALNALAGNFGKPGGLLEDVTPDLSDLRQEERLDHLPVFPGWGMQQDPSLPLIGGRRGEKVEPVELLLLLDANSFFRSSPRSRVQDQLRKIPFVVSCSTFMDECATQADLILPLHSFLECWGDDTPEPGIGAVVRTLSQPVVKPRFDTRAPGDLLLALVHELGPTLRPKMPWSNFAEMVRESFLELRKRKNGASENQTPEQFWEEVKSRGGYWEEGKDAGFHFQNPGGKFRFMPAKPLLLHLPAYKPVAENEFELSLFQSPAIWDGRGANLPWMQELPDPMTTVMWGNWAELNPAAAEKLGIKQGDLVDLETVFGRITLPVYLYPGIRPDAMAVPMGHGRNALRSNTGWEGNPLELMGAALSAMSTRESVQVKITKTGRSVQLATFGASSQIPASLMGKL